MLFDIHSNYGLGKAYKVLNYWNKKALEMNENPNDLDYVQEAKREIRAYNRKEDEETKDIITFHGNEYGTMKFKIKLPDWIKSKEEAKEWFDNNIRIVCMPHDYDCSGQWFTLSDYEFQNSEGNWMAFYTDAMDI